MFCHTLLKRDKNGRFMSELDVADKIVGLLIGGYDTTTSACSSVVKFLAELPEIYQKVYNERIEIAISKFEGELVTWDDIRKMKYSSNVVCEALRFCVTLAPPISGTFREALADFVYKGFTIPGGWKLFWNVNSTHKNPEFFPEPEKFDQSRLEGSGPTYGRFVILVFLHHLVKRYKWERVIPNEILALDQIPFPAKGLPVHLYLHKT